MAGITLFALLLGGRLQYIQRQIVFHRREAAAAMEVVSGKEKEDLSKVAKSADWMIEPGGKVALEKWPGWPASALHAGGYGMVVKNDAVDDWRRAIHHKRVADAYEQALVRPWVWDDSEFSTPSLPDLPMKPPPTSSSRPSSR
jgi:hypothetical protein